jgi:hypothetical protein
MNEPDIDKNGPLPEWEELSAEVQLQYIEQFLDQEVTAGRIVELLPVNGKRTWMAGESWQRTLAQN